MTGCSSWCQPARIREETLESSNLFSSSWILPPYRLCYFNCHFDRTDVLLGQFLRNAKISLWIIEFIFRFFTEQNNRLIQTLIDVSTSQDHQLTSDHMKSMGLDPIGDRSFLMELVETYGIDVMLMVDNPCCPTWCRIAHVISVVPRDPCYSMMSPSMLSRVIHDIQPSGPSCRVSFCFLWHICFPAWYIPCGWICHPM